MAKVFIYPATSLILSDLVARWGHKPLGAALAIPLLEPRIQQKLGRCTQPVGSEGHYRRHE